MNPTTTGLLRVVACRSLARELPIRGSQGDLHSVCRTMRQGRRDIQLEPKAAPMLLCQVSRCHLARGDAYHSCFMGGPLIRIENQTEWLGWWRQILRSVAPYIRVAMEYLEDLEAIPGRQVGRLPEDASRFFFECLSSAQFLDVG